MAAATFSTEDARRSVLESGFYHILDPEQRECATGMDRDDFALSSDYGLDFCKRMVLDDSVCEWQRTVMVPTYLTRYSASDPCYKLSSVGLDWDFICDTEETQVTSSPSEEGG